MADTRVLKIVSDTIPAGRKCLEAKEEMEGQTASL